MVCIHFVVVSIQHFEDQFRLLDEVNILKEERCHKTKNQKMQARYKFARTNAIKGSHTHTHIHTPALLPSVKRQVFCIGESLKMVKHQAWATTIVAPKSLGSMTAKGQMKPTFRLSLSASQVRENSQEMSPNIRSYPVF